MKTFLWTVLVVLGGCGGESDRVRPDQGLPDTVGTPTSTPSTTPDNGLLSQIHRRRGVSPVTTVREAALGAGLPAGVETVPVIEESDDGLTSTNVVRASRPTVACGVTGFTTLQARIDDCAAKNPNTSSWRGVTNGNAGEANWLLVARNASAQELWLDRHTGFVWSDLVASANWCKASGNGQGIVAGGTLDCAALGAFESRCAGAELWGIPTSEISWRLPTRGDFLQADLDGARYVLPRTGQLYWTATVVSGNREQAWVIHQETGTLGATSRDENRNVRCLGRRHK